MSAPPCDRLVTARNAKVSASLAIGSDNEGMTRETAIARVLLVLVFAPAGGLFGKGVAVAAAGHHWWPWLLAALGWLLLSGLASVAVSNRLDEHR
jgi:hypothetical protein